MKSSLPWMFLAFTLGCNFAHSQVIAPKSGLPNGPRTHNGVHPPPCWQQVGISKSVIEQRRSIEQSTHAQVESVCADASLTPQQRRMKIKEIRQQARAQVDSIITPQQQEELKACNAERNPVHGGGGGPRMGGGPGPCGEVLSVPPEGKGGNRQPPPNEPDQN